LVNQIFVSGTLTKNWGNERNFRMNDEAIALQRVLGFGNAAVIKHSHFQSTIDRTVAMLSVNER
jgi:hypothetical protein